MFNPRNRKFINKDYLNFIRKLPCCITGEAGEGVQSHHADVIGMQGIRNDYYAVPIKWNKHVTNRGHITPGRLQKAIGEDPRDLAIFCLSLYIEYLRGNYDPEMDAATNYLTLRRKLAGKE